MSTNRIAHISKFNMVNDHIRNIPDICENHGVESRGSYKSLLLSRYRGAFTEPLLSLLWFCKVTVFLRSLA